MSEQHLIDAVRIALDDIVDEVPAAPDWDRVGSGGAVLRRRQPLRGPLIAMAAATAVLVLVGGAILLSRGAAPAPGGPAEVVHDITGLIAGVDASSSLSGFEASNLIDGDPQTAWNDDSRRGADAVVSITFLRPVYVERVTIENLPRGDRRDRDYRVRLVQVTDGSSVLATVRIEDGAGPHVVAVDSTIERELTLLVLDVYPAQSTGDGPPFEELAIAEIRVFGHPLSDEQFPATTTPPSTSGDD